MLDQSTAIATGQSTLGQLRELVIRVTRLNIAPGDIPDTASLFDDCGLDSTSVVDLVLAMEEAFGITIAEDELDADLFQSLDTLGAFVDSKRAEIGVGQAS
jgi:acyl carrier protein